MRGKVGMLSRRVAPVLHLDASNATSITLSGSDPVAISDLSGTFADYSIANIGAISPNAKNGLQALSAEYSGQVVDWISPPVSASASSWNFLHTGKSNVFIVARSAPQYGTFPDYHGLTVRSYSSTRGYQTTVTQRSSSFNVQAYARYGSSLWTFRNQPDTWGLATWRLMHIRADATVPTCDINISGTSYTALTESGSVVNLDCDTALRVSYSGDGTSGSLVMLGELLVFGEMDEQHAAETRSSLNQKWGL